MNLMGYAVKCYSGEIFSQIDAHEILQKKAKHKDTFVANGSMIVPNPMWKGSPRIMISIAELKSIAESHLLDAEVLFAGDRFDGVMYISGYVLELSLKERICKTLGWDKFPDNEKGYTSFKTHNIEVLLHLSGFEDQIRKNLQAELSVALSWNPENRYTRSGNTTKNFAQQMLDSVKALKGAL